MHAEYVVVLCTVAVGACLAIAAAGLELLNLLIFQQAMLLSPLP